MAQTENSLFFQKQENNNQANQDKLSDKLDSVETIAAIITPLLFGAGAVGIIKISGPKALDIIAAIFRTRQNKQNKKISLKSHKIYFGEIFDNIDDNIDLKILDEVLVLPMLAPRSYTRENIIEIQAHSSVPGLKAILNLILKKGARLALPGEFTKRAFLNGRIDLSQAEAIIDIINAKTDKALQIAVSQINGSIKSQIESLKKNLVSILAQIEALIDFPEDIDFDLINKDNLLEFIDNKIISCLEKLINNYNFCKIIKDGAKIAIVGKPNVGKSSILNALIQKERAIVTDIPGTTRDFIEELIDLNGIPITIADTAGIRDFSNLDMLEQAGIKKTYDYIANSDLILFVLDSSKALTHDDLLVYEAIKNHNIIILLNKADIFNNFGKFEILNNWSKHLIIKTSAIKNLGLDFVKNNILDILINKEINFESEIIPNLRHKIALNLCLEAIKRAKEQIILNNFYEIIAIEINEAICFLDEILGIKIKEEILDEIFSNFCIGK